MPNTLDDGDVYYQVYGACGLAIEEAKLETYDRDVLLSIVSSASHAAKGVHKVHKDYFRRLGNLTVNRAVPFVGVFAVAMTSRWVRHMCTLDPSLERGTTWARFALVVLQLFGDASQERYEEAWLLDAQFNHDQSLVEEGTGFAFCHQQLLLCLAARALGAPFTWKLSSPPIPFASLSDLMKRAPGWDPPAELNLLSVRGLIEVQDEMSASEAGMYAAFRTLRQNNG